MTTFRLRSLKELCCEIICQTGEDFIECAIGELPCHLAPLLLWQAIEGCHDSVTTCIIACWPLTELCLSDVLSKNQRYLIEQEYMLDRLIFAGITARRHCCKMKVLNLCGLNVNSSLCNMLLYNLPWLSLEKSQLSSAVWTDRLLKSADESFLSLIEKMWFGRRRNSAGHCTRSYTKHQEQLGLSAHYKVSADCVTAGQIVQWLIDDMLKSVSHYCSKVHIKLNKGDTLLVSFDKLELDFRHNTIQCTHNGTSSFLKLLIVGHLQGLMPVQIKYCNIILRSPQVTGEVESTSRSAVDDLSSSHHCVQYLLSQQPCQNLTGVWMNGVDIDSALRKWVVPNGWTCCWLTTLGLRNANLDVALNGRPASEKRQSQRRMRCLVKLLRALPNLSSLDLGGNCLSGQLLEILEAVGHPLDRLSLSGHEFEKEDVDAIAGWRHAAALQELDVGNSVFHSDVVGGRKSCALVIALRRYVALQRLCFARSELFDVSDMCSAISDGCWPLLQFFDVSVDDVQLEKDEVLRLAVVSLTKCSRLVELCIPAAGLRAPAIRNIVDKAGRNDLRVTPSRSNSFLISNGVTQHSTFLAMSSDAF